MNPLDNNTPTKAMKGYPAPLIVIVMGVSGCGKSTVAQLIANELKFNDQQAHFKDGDELHPDSNIKKMASGEALTDEDRQPWLIDVANYARAQAQQFGICVIACSALKNKYRTTLNHAGNVIYVFLNGSYELIAARMHQRSGHFMPEQLLNSQFAALEDPTKEPNVLTVSIDAEAAEVAKQAVALINNHTFVNC